MLSRTALPAPLPPAPVTGAAAAARRLGDRLTRLIRPLRVLDAVRWPDETERAFLASRGARPPTVGPDTYRRRPLPFCPAETARGLRALDGDIRSELGTADPAARLLRKAVREG